MVLLGVVGAGANKSVPIPANILAAGEPIQLVADPIGSNDWHKAAPLSLTSTSQIDFIVENPLERSTVSVRM